jgi:hypothetical protein
MKIKLITAAAALLVAGAANAAIDAGATGNGSLFLTIWDGANSYTTGLTDTNGTSPLTIDGFQTGVAAAGDYNNFVNLALDSKFTAFMATVNQATMQWNIMAADASGPRRLIETYDQTVTPVTKTNDIVRTMIGGVSSFVTAVNTGIAAQGGSNSATFAAGVAGYADNTTGITFGNNNSGLLGFVNSGSFAANTYGTGLNMLRIDGAASGVAVSTLTQYADNGTAVHAYLTTNGLTLAAVAAVPEPESYAMLLAGLGLMGTIGRRRRNQA